MVCEIFHANVQYLLDQKMTSHYKQEFSNG